MLVISLQFFQVDRLQMRIGLDPQDYPISADIFQSFQERAALVQKSQEAGKVSLSWHDAWLAHAGLAV